MTNNNFPNKASESSPYLFFHDLNLYCGMVTFAVLIVMISNNHWSFTLKKTKLYIRLVIYLDACGFFFKYLALILHDYLAYCDLVSIVFVADLTWLLKDGALYIYIFSRTIRLSGWKKANEYADKFAYFAGLCSVLAYSLYMCGSYSFEGDCTQTLQSKSKYEWSLICLYIFFALADFIAFSFCFTKFVTTKDYPLGATAHTLMYHSLVRREVIRLMLICFVLFLVMVLTIFQLTFIFAVPRINTLVQVYTQILLYYTSCNLAEDKLTAKEPVNRISRQRITIPPCTLNIPPNSSHDTSHGSDISVSDQELFCDQERQLTHGTIDENDEIFPEVVVADDKVRNRHVANIKKNPKKLGLRDDIFDGT